MIIYNSNVSYHLEHKYIMILILSNKKKDDNYIINNKMLIYNSYNYYFSNPYIINFNFLKFV
jgi:hypothetical protein